MTSHHQTPPKSARLLMAASRIMVSGSIAIMWIIANLDRHPIQNWLIASAFAAGAWIGLPMTDGKSGRPGKPARNIELFTVPGVILIALSVGVILDAFERPALQVSLGLLMLIGFCTFRILQSNLEGPWPEEKVAKKVQK